MDLLDGVASSYLFRANERSRGFPRTNFAVHIQDIPDDVIYSNAAQQSTSWLFAADLNLAAEFSFSSRSVTKGSDFGEIVARVGSVVPSEALSLNESYTETEVN